MKHIQVSEETYEAIKDQLAPEENPEPIEKFNDIVGRSFFFRTVTYHLVGKVVRSVSYSKIVELECASWVASSGRFADAIKDGTLSEVEPVGTAFLNMDTVTDFFPWNPRLPTEQK